MLPKNIISKSVFLLYLVIIGFCANFTHYKKYLTLKTIWKGSFIKAYVRPIVFEIGDIGICE